MMPKRLQVFEDTLYVTLYDQTIYRTNKFGHNMGEIMVESFQRASDLLIVHPLKQDLKSNFDTFAQENCFSQIQYVRFFFLF